MIPFSDRAAGSVVQPCPLADKPKNPHWLEIQLIGEDEQPIQWMAYKIVLPDGDEVMGYLDADGLARVDNIKQPGVCKVSFPELDKDAWAPLSTSAQGT